jgi:hypothetical protein
MNEDDHIQTQLGGAPLIPAGLPDLSHQNWIHNRIETIVIVAEGYKWFCTVPPSSKDPD